MLRSLRRSHDHVNRCLLPRVALCCSLRLKSSSPELATARHLDYGSARPEPYADTLATVVAGRTALVERLRAIAARIEALPLESAAEVLIVLEAAMAA